LKIIEENKYKITIICKFILFAKYNSIKTICNCVATLLVGTGGKDTDSIKPFPCRQLQGVNSSVQGQNYPLGGVRNLKVCVFQSSSSFCLPLPPPDPLTPAAEATPGSLMVAVHHSYDILTSLQQSVTARDGN